MNYSPLSRRALLLALFSAAAFAARAQNIGVGTLTPTEKLEVVGGNLKLRTAGSQLIFPDGTTQGTAASGTGTGSFILNAPTSQQSGSFNLSGAGTLGGNLTAPAAVLRSGAGGFIELQNSGTTAATPYIDFSETNTTTDYSTRLISQSGTLNVFSTVANTALQVNGGMAVDNANANTGTAATFLRFGATGSGEGIGSKRNAGGNYTGLDFYTAFTNRLSITNGGNVGIGTGSPFSRLSMGGTDNANAPGGRFAIYENANGQNFYGLGLVQNTGGLYGTGLWGSSGSALPYSGSAGGTLPQLFVQGNGNVGVGTISPRGQFDVAGTGDTYLTSNPNNSGTQSLYLPGHIFLAPYNNTTNSSAYIQARSGTAGANLGIVFRATNAGNYFDALILQANGTANFSGNVTSPGGFTNTSDRRFKQNVRPLGNALASVLALRGVRYEWNALGIKHGGTAGAGQVGLIAQELEVLYPELVLTDAAGYKSVNYAQLTPVLIEAIKELAARNTVLEAKAAQAEADHASLLTLQAQMARLLGEGAQAQK